MDVQSVIKGHAAHPNSEKVIVEPVDLADMSRRLRSMEEKVDRVYQLARLAEAHPLIRRFLGLGGR